MCHFWLTSVRQLCFLKMKVLSRMMAKGHWGLTLSQTPLYVKSYYLHNLWKLLSLFCIQDKCATKKKKSEAWTEVGTDKNIDLWTHFLREGTVHPLGEMLQFLGWCYDRAVLSSQAYRRLESPGPMFLPLALRQDSIIYFVYPIDPGETLSARLPCHIWIQLDIPGPPPGNYPGRTSLKYEGEDYRFGSRTLRKYMAVVH